MKIFDKITNLIQRYSVITRRINEKVTLKQTFLVVFQSIILTTLILLIPILLVVNLWIIPELEFVLRLFVVIISIFYIYLYFSIYYYLIKINYLNESYNTNLVKYVEMSILLFFVIPICSLLMFL